MKTFLPFMILALLVVCTTYAQDAKTLPRTEFSLELSSSSLTVNAGQSGTVDINLLRSKTYKKSAAVLGVSSTLPEGIDIEFQPEAGIIDHSTVKITVSPSAKAGVYNVILKVTMQNHTKGVTLKLAVDNAANSTSSSGR